MTAAIAKAIWVIGIVGWYVIRHPFRRRAARFPPVRSVGGALDRSLLLIAITAQFIVPVAYVATGQPGFAGYVFRPWQGWLGLVAMVGALVLFRVSHKQLGRNWSITLETREKHALVTEGVYALVRHPMYTSFFLAALAQALLLPNWIAGPCGLVGIAILYALRIGREERLMIETFGDAYRAYMGRTARLIPWVY
jgi:protein-S-isoprenylcysteine O-methyltransferase Ste14